MADIKPDYYLDGKFMSDKNIFYYKDGVLHREDGPAVEFANGNKVWYYQGKYINCATQKQFVKIINMRAFW
tara:strand:+ start:2380 stop:2592 length:213 start_codon:yes stop_codon:yes gene_type:complete